MPQMVLEYVLYLHEIEPGVDVEIITNLAFTSTAGAFVGGIGDFTAEFDPAALEIELSGHGEVVIIGLSKTNPIKTGFANLVLFFSQARLKKLTNKKH